MVFNHDQTSMFSRIIHIHLCALQACSLSNVSINTSLPSYIHWMLFLYKLFFFFCFDLGFLFVCLWTHIILFIYFRLSFPYQSHCSMPCQQTIFLLPHAFPENRLLDSFQCLKDSRAPKPQVFFN